MARVCGIRSLRSRNSPPVLDRDDPALLDSLKTAPGQKVLADSARQFAAAIIAAAGGADPTTAVTIGRRAAIIAAGDGANLTSDQPTGGKVTATFASAMAVSAPKKGETAPRTMPAFPQGNATSVTK